MARASLRLIVMAAITCLSGLLGWILYPSPDRPPVNSFESLHFDVIPSEPRARVDVHSTVTITNGGDTKLTVVATMSRNADDQLHGGPPSLDFTVLYSAKLRATVESIGSPDKTLTTTVRKDPPVVADSSVKLIDFLTTTRIVKRGFLVGTFTLKFSGQPLTARSGSWLQVRTPRVDGAGYGGATATHIFCMPESMSDFVVVRGPAPTADFDSSCDSWTGTESTDTLLRSAVGQDQSDKGFFLSGLLLGLAGAGAISVVDGVFDLSRPRGANKRPGADRQLQHGLWPIRLMPPAKVGSGRRRSRRVLTLPRGLRRRW
jgi:hypothetical protein